jgi:hypothetical protein
LDLVEAKIQVPPLFHIVDHGNMTFEEANARLLLRIEKWNPTRAKLYRDWLQSFFSEVRWLPAATFTDLKDEGDGKVFPNNCELRQAVLQWRNICRLCPTIR